MRNKPVEVREEPEERKKVQLTVLALLLELCHKKEKTEHRKEKKMIQEKNRSSKHKNQIIHQKKQSKGQRKGVIWSRRRVIGAVPRPATERQPRATYGRGGGSRQERQDASTGDDDVVHHLRNEVDGVVDEDDVLIAVDEVHHRLGGVAESRSIVWGLKTHFPSSLRHQSSGPPPPRVHVGLQSEQQVGEQPLVHGRPLELWDAEHGGAGAGAELAPLLLRHGHAPEPQVHTQVPLQLGRAAPVKSLWDGTHL